MKFLIINFQFLILALALTLSTSCSRYSEGWASLDAADALMEEWPDSALTILAAIDTDSLRPGHERARHALLLSMALDKNMMDMDSFTYIQPAIDYYAHHGTPDERLRTLYYTGRIHTNRGENDLALQCFIQGKDLKNEITDSLTYARLLVAEGLMYHASYNAEKITPIQIEAAHIFRAKNKTPQEFRSWLKAFEGANIIEDKALTDSIKHICDSIIAVHPEFGPSFLEHEVTYLTYCTPPDTALRLFAEIIANNELNDDTKLNLALGYTLLGNSELGLYYFNQVDSSRVEMPDGSKYLSVKVTVLDSAGLYSEAFKAYKAFNEIAGVKEMDLLRQDFYFAQEHHDTRKERDEERRSKETFMWICALSVLCIVLLIALGYYLLKTSRLKLNEARLTRRLENEKFAAIITSLELKRDELESIISKMATPADEECAKVIRERIDLLNKFLGKQITKTEMDYNKPLQQLVDDKQNFITSTRLVLEETHPNFIRILTHASLTTEEIEIVGLYILGLRGKDIQNFTNNTAVYHKSSNIRQKLGLTKSGSQNLGPYLMELFKNS